MSLAKKATSTVPITEALVATFRPAKRLSHHDSASITSLDFDDTGQYLVSAGVDKSIQVYDCYKGTHHKDVQSQKYGAHLARFTHAFECLYASTPVIGTPDPDHSIRYLSLASKGYLRYFKGHKDQVLQLEVNPVGDTFMTLSADHTVKHWDLRLPSPTGSVGTGATAVVGFDPRGIMFATGTCDGNTGTVLFYDTTAYERAAFLVSHLDTFGETWTKLEFSNNGRYVLIGTSTHKHVVLDAVLGKALAFLASNNPAVWSRLDYGTLESVCFTPDGKYVLSGMPNGSVSVYSLVGLKAGADPVVLRPYATLPCTQTAAKIVAFNPKLLTFASADNQVVLWSANLE